MTEQQFPEGMFPDGFFPDGMFPQTEAQTITIAGTLTLPIVTAGSGITGRSLSGNLVLVPVVSGMIWVNLDPATAWQPRISRRAVLHNRVSQEAAVTLRISRRATLRRRAVA